MSLVERLHCIVFLEKEHPVLSSATSPGSLQRSKMCQFLKTGLALSRSFFLLFSFLFLLFFLPSVASYSPHFPDANVLPPTATIKQNNTSSKKKLKAKVKRARLAPLLMIYLHCLTRTKRDGATEMALFTMRWHWRRCSSTKLYSDSVANVEMEGNGPWT